jgi:hypothetical protein
MKLKVLTLALFLTVALVPPSTSHKIAAARALPACDLERMFFSDDTFIDDVGSYHITCYGTNYWGARTNYYEHTEYGECGYGYGTCSGVDFRCSNGTITWASVAAYVGQPCTKYVN